jgi:hypothetical protein
VDEVVTGVSHNSKLISQLGELSKESRCKRLVVDDADNCWDTVADRNDVLAQGVVRLAEFVGVDGQRVIDCYLFNLHSCRIEWGGMHLSIYKT